MTEVKLAVTCFVVVIIIALVLPFLVFSEPNRPLYFVGVCIPILMSIASIGWAIRRR